MDTSQLFDTKVITSVIWPAIMEYTPKVIGFFIAIIAARILANWSSRLVHKALSKADDALQKFLTSLTKYAVLTLGVVTALGYLGVQTAGFAAVIAASGLALGLAFQGTLSNFSAGVMLLIFRPFKVGDYIEAGGVAGLVEEIQIFTTEIKSLDNKRLIVPNSAIFGSNVVNFTHHPVRRVDIPVGTEYPADLEKTREVLEAVPGRVEGALTEPAPQIFLAALGTHSIDWQVRVWCATGDYWDVHQRTIAATKKALDDAGIGIPFPQSDVHFDPAFVRAVGGLKQ